MIAVIDNQNFDGSFSLKMELCQAISLPYEEVKAGSLNKNLFHVFYLIRIAFAKL